MAAKITELLVAPAVHITVDPSQLSVSMALGLSDVLTNSAGSPYFQEGDSPTIQEIGLSLPYQYCMGEGIIGVTLEWKAETGEVQEIYGGSIPTPNAPFLLDLYSRNPQGSAWPARSRLVMRCTGDVSMVYNPPAIVSGTVLTAIAWAKVVHLLPLEAV